jgi:ribokinase
MITVFGSIGIDLTFALPHLPSVGETVLTPTLTQALGGKGANQAVAASRDGIPTRFIGCVGRDAFGQSAREALTREGIDATQLTAVAAPTALAAVWIDGEGRNAIAVASGANGELRATALTSAALPPASLLLLQMEIPAHQTEAAIRIAKQARAKVLLNLAPALPLPRNVLRSVDILVINEHEAFTLCAALGLAAAGEDGLDVETTAALAQALAAALGVLVVVTLGAHGAIAVAGGATLRATALAIEPRDTTGAGDCFVGVLAAGLMRGLELEGALQRAAVAGSLACTRLGASPSFPTRLEIDAAVARLPQGRSR